VIGKLLDILEANDAPVSAMDRGKAGRCLVDIKGRYSLEAGSGPAFFKGSRTHIIGACHNGGG